MCGLLMIALLAKATLARPPATEKRVLIAVEEDRSTYSNLKLRPKKYGSALPGHKCRNEPFDGLYV